MSYPSSPFINLTPVNTGQPSQQPSAQPTMQPSGILFLRFHVKSNLSYLQTYYLQKKSLSNTDAHRCTGQPSLQPSTQPSHLPNASPSSQPSFQPSAQPSRQPTLHPSRFESMTIELFLLTHDCTMSVGYKMILVDGLAINADCAIVFDVFCVLCALCLFSWPLFVLPFFL